MSLEAMTSDLLMREAAIGAPVSAVLMAVFGACVGQLAVGLAHVTSLGAPKDEIRKGTIRGGSAGFAAGLLLGATAGAAHVMFWASADRLERRLHLDGDGAAAEAGVGRADVELVSAAQFVVAGFA